MSKPIRLLDSAPSSPAAALFRAALAERAPKRLPQHIIAGLSVAVAANTTAAAAAAGSASFLGGAALATAKWLVVGMAGGVLLAAGASAAFTPQRAPASHAVSTTRTQSSPAATGATAERAEAAAPPRVESKQPSAPPERPASSVAAAVAPVSSSEPPTGEPPASSQLARELRLIRAARHALASGDAAGALRELSEYQALAVTGVLDREARVLRIESFAKLGELARAQQLAAAYVREFPRDAYGPRLQVLLRSEARGGSVGPVRDTNLGRSPTQ